MDDLIPLYKILCITIILLVPVLPAWFLYKIAPKSKILAKGTFQGFKINATGAIAVFIVLFTAIYAYISDVTKSIDNISDYNKNITELNSQIQSLKEKMPWRLECKIKIFGSNNSEANYSDYATCLNPYTIQATPMPVTINSSTRIISFYVDDEVLKEYNDTCTIILPNGYGTQNLSIPSSCKNDTSKTIFLTANFKKQSASTNLRGNTNDNLHLIDSSAGLDNLPNINK
ncbi:MAG TPA: hypothetical protein VGI61_03420 [Parafilimonas sp.]